MHPDDLLRSTRSLGDPVDRDRRRVGREHRVRGSRRLDLAQHLLLDLEVLEHRLDDELGPAEPAVVIAPREQRDEPGVLVGGDAPPLEPVVEDVARRSEALRNPREIGVLHAHVHPRLHDRGARNARPHEPRAHDPEAAHDRRRRWVGDPEVLFESGSSEKDLDQLTRDVGDGQLPEQLRLALQTFRHAVFESVLHRLQCGERRGIVAAGLGQDLFSGRAEDQRPAQWVAVEQPSAKPARPLTPWAPPARQALRSGDGDVLENGGMDQLVDDAEAKRLLGGFDLAGEDDVERRAGADQPGEPLATTRARENSELYLREAELGPGVIGSHAVAAGERELEPTAQARSMDPDGDRFGETGHPPQHFLPLGRKPLGFRGGGEPNELLDVCTRDEVLGFPRKERDGSYGGVVLQRVERREQVLLHRGREFVDRLTLQVEGDDGNAVVGELPGERRAGSHQRRSSTMAKPIPPCAQIDSRPNCTSRRVISFASVVTSRVPVAPNGWPMAIEPPITLMMSWLISQPSASHPCKFESTCAANASCTSILPRSFHWIPARSSALGTAKMGAWSSCHPGSTAATA